MEVKIHMLSEEPFWVLSYLCLERPQQYDFVHRQHGLGLCIGKVQTTSCAACAALTYITTQRTLWSLAYQSPESPHLNPSMHLVQMFHIPCLSYQTCPAIRSSRPQPRDYAMSSGMTRFLINVLYSIFSKANKGKPECKFVDMVAPSTFTIYHHKVLKHVAQQHHFWEDWKTLDLFADWLMAKPAVGSKSNLMDLFMWYSVTHGNDA